MSPHRNFIVTYAPVTRAQTYKPIPLHRFVAFVASILMLIYSWKDRETTADDIKALHWITHHAIESITEKHKRMMEAEANILHIS